MDKNERDFIILQSFGTYNNLPNELMTLMAKKEKVDPIEIIESPEKNIVKELEGQGTSLIGKLQE